MKFSVPTLKRTVGQVTMCASLLALSACDTNYWWSRGQPPSSSELLARAEGRVNTALAASRRQDVAAQIGKIKEMLVSSSKLLDAKTRDSSAIEHSMSLLEDEFFNLEDNLAVTSRPAFSELSGQLRILHKELAAGKQVDAAVFELFAARALFLLSSELEIPAPVA